MHIENVASRLIKLKNHCSHFDKCIDEPISDICDWFGAIKRSGTLMFGDWISECESQTIY